MEGTIPTTLPQQLPVTKNVTSYILHLGDSALIQGHRNSEWTGHGPVLEQDIALSNISLDLIGQARMFYQLAARLLTQRDSARQQRITEDTLAFLRDAREYRNFLINELPNGDWGRTILKQFLFSSYQYVLFEQLKTCNYPELAEIAEKAFKEVTYHFKWSAEWVIRLGDGTDESHIRMQKALQDLWPYTGELYSGSPVEQELSSIHVIPKADKMESAWKVKVTTVLKEATLLLPGDNGGKVFMQYGGKEGLHTEHLGFLLAEMQYMQRTYPNCEW